MTGRRVRPRSIGADDDTELYIYVGCQSAD